MEGDDRLRARCRELASGARALVPQPSGVSRRRSPRAFLTARWENLVLANFECPRGVLEPLVPAGTTLDPWEGVDLVSLVGLMFLDTRLLGVSLPWHRAFAEVNLRFYVRRSVPGGRARRAVVFIREVVPRRLVAVVARLAYNEPYVALPMDHRIALDPDAGGVAEYRWRRGDARFVLGAEVEGPASPSPSGSEAEFVTEHHWGYTRQADGGTLEYRVEHPPWSVWEADGARRAGPWPDLYGAELGEVLSRPPRSVYVAVGSEVAVYRGRRIA